MDEPMDLLNDLKTRREATFGSLQRMLDTAENERRDLTTGEDAEYRALEQQLDQLDARITALRGDEARSTAATSALAGPRNRPATRGGQRGESPLMDEFRSMILDRNPRPIDISAEGARSGYQPGIEKRDLITSAPANMSPVSFYGRIVEHMVESSAVLRAGATLLTTETGEALRVPRSTALSTAAITSEATQIAESDPTLSSVELGAHKYAIRIEVSNEMVRDSGIDLEGYLAREMGQAIGLALGNHLINGTGTGQPRGVLADATAGITAPAGVLTGLGAQGTAGQGTDLLYDLYGSLAEPYVMQPGAAWLMRSATLTAIRKLKTTTAGELVGGDFVTAGPAGASASMVGSPVYVDPYVPAMAASAKSILFGDWSRYFVRMAGGLRIESSQDFAFDRDVTTFRAILRADGRLIDNTGAIKYLAHPAT